MGSVADGELQRIVSELELVVAILKQENDRPAAAVRNGDPCIALRCAAPPRICYHRVVVNIIRFAGARALGCSSATRESPFGRSLVAAAIVPALLLSLLQCDDADPDPSLEPQPPLMNHGLPNEAAQQMCVVCHTCGGDGTIDDAAPVIDRTHDVCNACHAPDGTVIVHGDESCEWDMDCDAVPPIINCDECHTVKYVNDLCEACHSPSAL